MGKNKNSESAAADDAPAEAKEAPQPERRGYKRAADKIEYAVKKTHLGDSATIKRLMDDAVVHVLLDKEEGYGYSEDTSMSNLKLFVGFIGVGASLVSHVYPAPFPKNWWVLLLCCAFYFAMSGVLQLLLSFVELESMLVVRAKPDQGKHRAYNFSSHFPRFQEVYTLGITPVPGSALSMYAAPRFRPDIPNGNTEPDCLQCSWSVESALPDTASTAAAAATTTTTTTTIARARARPTTPISRRPTRARSHVPLPLCARRKNVPAAEFFDEEGTFAEETFMTVVSAFVNEYEQLVASGGKKDK